MNPPFHWEEPATYSDEWLQQAKAYHSSHAYPDYADDDPTPAVPTEPEAEATT